MANDWEQFIKLLTINTIFDKRKRRPYESLVSLASFGTKAYVELGLSPEEKKLYEKFEDVPGKALVVGCSAGRECIYLARRGWMVAGIDYVGDLIKIAKAYAKRENLDINYAVMDVSSLREDSFAKGTYDFIAFSILPLISPSRLRNKVLRILREYLAERGKMVVIYQGRRINQRISNPILWFLLKSLRPSYEKGDYYSWGSILHVFTEAELEKEAQEAGFQLRETSCGDIYKWALLEKI